MKSKEFLDSLKSIAQDLQADIEAHTHAWDNSQKAIEDRRAKVFDAASGFEYFVMNYFPHYLRHDSQSQLHEYLFDRLPSILVNPKSQTDAFAAPRGEAKSTIGTRLFSLYCVITNQKKYIAIISDIIEQAAEFLLAIKMELESNPRLKIDFPEACGVGRTWNVYKILTKNGIRVQCAGSAKSLRGLVRGAYRPDLVMLDDLENDESVENPKQRDKLQKWLNSTVLKLGAPGEKMDVVYIGTILHYDSVLNRTLNNKGWKSRVFKAIIRWPNDMTLWDEWEAIYHSDGPEVAEAFYLKRKKAMDKGAIVSWAARPLYELMFVRARDGHSSFDTEMQNDPAAGEDAPFNDAIKYWHEVPNGVIYFGACDPSLGKFGASRDPSAIGIGGFDRQNGILYVIRADIKKRLPDRIISDIIELQRKFKCVAWAIESVQFQEFLRTELVKRSAKAGVPVPAVAVNPHTDKLLRIEALQPHMQNGLLLLSPEHKTLISQFKHFPKADHDDGPDMVQMLWSIAIKYGEVREVRAIHVPEPSLYH